MRFKKFFKNKKHLWIILILTIFSILINGYIYGIYGNTQWTIPNLKSYIDPSLYPGDDLLAGREDYSSAPYYYSFFWLIMIPLGKIIDLQLLFFIVFFLSTFFILLAIFLIAKLLFKNEKIAYLAVFLFMIRKPGLATSTIFPNLAARVVVFPILLFAIYFFLNKRYFIAFFLAGLGFSFHPILGIIVLFLLFFYIILNYKKYSFVNIIKYFLILLLGALPVIVWRLLLPIPDFDFSIQSYMNLLSIVGITRHTSPFSWPIGRVLRYFIFVVAFFLAFSIKPSNKEMHKKIMTFVAGIFVLFTIALVFSEFIPLPFILLFSLWRASIYLAVFGILYLSNFIYHLFEENLFSKLVATGMALSIFLSNFKGLFLFLILFLAFKFQKNKLIYYTSTLIFILGLALGILGTLYPNVPYLSLFKLGVLPLFIISFGMFVIILLEKIKKVHRNKKIINTVFMLSIFFILIITSYYIISIRPQLNDPGRQVAEITLLNIVDNPLSLKEISIFLNEPLTFLSTSVQFPKKIPSDSWQDIQIWAKENTLKTEKFITPPHLSGFRVYSERSTMVDCMDGSNSNNAVHLFEWFDRISLVCKESKFRESCDIECSTSFYLNDENDFLEITKEYGSKYLVAEKGKMEFNFNKIFENDGFIVYLLNDI